MWEVLVPPDSSKLGFGGVPAPQIPGLGGSSPLNPPKTWFGRAPVHQILPKTGVGGILDPRSPKLGVWGGSSPPNTPKLGFGGFPAPQIPQNWVLRGSQHTKSPQKLGLGSPSPSKTPQKLGLVDPGLPNPPKPEFGGVPGPPNSHNTWFWGGPSPLKSSITCLGGPWEGMGGKGVLDCAPPYFTPSLSPSIPVVSSPPQDGCSSLGTPIYPPMGDPLHPPPSCLSFPSP